MLLGGAGSAVALTDVASAHLREVRDHFNEGAGLVLPIGFPYVRLNPRVFWKKNHEPKPRELERYSEPEKYMANRRPAIIRARCDFRSASSFTPETFIKENHKSK